jgi:hypothetical protein
LQQSNSGEEATLHNQELSPIVDTLTKVKKVLLKMQEHSKKCPCCRGIMHDDEELKQ